MVSKSVDRFNEPLDVSTLESLSPHSQLLFAVDCAERLSSMHASKQCSEDHSCDTILKNTIENFRKYIERPGEDKDPVSGLVDPDYIREETCLQLVKFLSRSITYMCEYSESDQTSSRTEGLVWSICRIAFATTSNQFCPTQEEHASERKWQNERILHYKSEE